MRRRAQHTNGTELPVGGRDWHVTAATVASVVLLMTVSLSGCAGAKALQRKTGPKYIAETHSWVHAVQKLGGNGMWLVTRGYHAGDDVVAVATNSPLSHAAILDLDKQEVIEAIGTGVVVTHLRKFLREAHRVLVIKPEGWTEELGQLAVTKARTKVGQGYDFLGVVGVPDKDRWYCSELAAWSMGLEVNKLGPHKIIHPRNMHRHGKVLFDSRGRDGQSDDVKGDKLASE